jgi:hypothetical protein
MKCDFLPRNGKTYLNDGKLSIAYSYLFPSGNIKYLYLQLRLRVA